jgi:NADH-quinone oxidoreductase subunit M
MAKTAGYGLLRFVVPLFPEAVEHVAPWAMALGVVTILYASWLAYGQTDLKRLIAYSSAGHLGYVVLGAFALNDLGTRGAVMQMVCHGISVTGLFLLADVTEQHTGTRDIERLGGLWKSAPRLGSVALFFALATLGLPGIGNFVGEFLVLVGAFQSYPVMAATAAIGAVVAAAYSLRFVQRVFFGPGPQTQSAEIAAPTFAAYAVLICILVWLGLYPQPVLDAARIANERIHSSVIATATHRPAGDRP